MSWILNIQPEGFYSTVPWTSPHLAVLSPLQTCISATVSTVSPFLQGDPFYLQPPRCLPIPCPLQMPHAREALALMEGWVPRLSLYLLACRCLHRPTALVTKPDFRPHFGSSCFMTVEHGSRTSSPAVSGWTRASPYPSSLKNTSHTGDCFGCLLLYELVPRLHEGNLRLN